MTEELTPKKVANEAPHSSTPRLANAEIDSRLAQAIRERAKAMQMVSKLAHWNDRLGRLEQEINSLIGYKQRLENGVERVEIYGQTSDGRITPAPLFSHLNEIPDTVTSIPAKQSIVTKRNVAQISEGEGGFS